MCSPNHTSREEIPTAVRRRPANRTGCSNRVFHRSEIKVARGAKQYLYDEQGQEYLDCTNGTAHVGHCHPQVVDAAHNQMARLGTAQGFICNNLETYVTQLVETLPEPLSVCYLTNSGSEANDLAIRLARQFTMREDMLTVEEGYLGNLGLLVELSHKMYNRVPGHKVKDWVHLVPLPNTYREPDTLEEGDVWDHHFRLLETRLAEADRKGRPIAAFISESMFVISGVFCPPPRYFQSLYRLVRAHGGLLIADEVQTGLGRTGENMWAFSQYEVVPDIVTVGKPLGNGHPMGAVICTREISDRLNGYYSTFGGNPVSCTIGLAVMEIIRNEKLVCSAKMVGRFLQHQLNLLKERFEMLGDVRGLGLVQAVEIVRSACDKTPAPDLAAQVMYGLLERHILVAVTGSYDNVVLITPPMCFTMENARRLVQNLDEILSMLSAEAEAEAATGGSSGLCSVGGGCGCSRGGRVDSRQPLVHGFTRDQTVSVIVRPTYPPSHDGPSASKRPAVDGMPPPSEAATALLPAAKRRRLLTESSEESDNYDDMD